jgi:uncharacterized protein with PIN domain
MIWKIKSRRLRNAGYEERVMEEKEKREKLFLEKIKERIILKRIV